MDPSWLVRTARRICRASRQEVKFQFGVKVPRTIREAYSFDATNGDKLWSDAIQTDIPQLLEFGTFNILKKGVPIPKGYQKIPMIVTFAVKHNV